MAFYARSEEARKSHSVHKLALGALALEDALSKGLPIQKEKNRCPPYLSRRYWQRFGFRFGLNFTSRRDMIQGDDTLLQLNQKIKNVDESGDGIESIIGRVENYLAQGKLTEAADILEEGVKGSRAEEIVREWVNRARNRAITEQAFTVLQSYATRTMRR